MLTKYIVVSPSIYYISGRQDGRRDAKNSKRRRVKTSNIRAEVLGLLVRSK
jgi:hypothetical protein